MFHFDVFARILELGLGIAQSDNQKAMEWIRGILPFEVRSYASRSEHNGWVIPDDWSVQRALVQRGGRVLFDGTVHPLAVASYSRSFQGVVSKSELDRHVFHSQRCPDAFAYHCRGPYRPWEELWGFSVPYNEYRTWPDGDYEVDLVTAFQPGRMLVGELEHRGESEETVLFQAHTCHAAQANDDMSGVMVIVALFERLARRRTRYTYRALLCPEHLGTVYYLRDLSPDARARIRLTCFVEAVGSDTPFALQRSYHGDHVHDRVLSHLLRQRHPDHRTGEFSTVVGNDEAVWEAPGIEVPSVSISRFPYREYHTSEDDLRRLSEARLRECLDLLEGLIDVLETDGTVRRRFEGLVALSNPRFGLYAEHPDPTLRKDLPDLALRFAAAQDRLPRSFDGRATAFDIAERFDLPYEALRPYLSRWEEVGLVELEPVTTLDLYDRARGDRGDAVPPEGRFG